MRCRLFHVHNRRNPRWCHATIVSGFTMCTVERQPPHACESHAQKDSVGRREAKTWAAGSVHHGDLVPERDDFQVQRDA